MNTRYEKQDKFFWPVRENRRGQRGKASDLDDYSALLEVGSSEAYITEVDRPRIGQSTDIKGGGLRIDTKRIAN